MPRPLSVLADVAPIMMEPIASLLKIASQTAHWTARIKENASWACERTRRVAMPICKIFLPIILSTSIVIAPRTTMVPPARQSLLSAETVTVSMEACAKRPRRPTVLRSTTAIALQANKRARGSPVDIVNMTVPCFAMGDKRLMGNNFAQIMERACLAVLTKDVLVPLDTMGPFVNLKTRSRTVPTKSATSCAKTMGYAEREPRIWIFWTSLVPVYLI